MSVEFSSQTQKLHMAIFEFGWKLKNCYGTPSACLPLMFSPRIALPPFPTSSVFESFTFGIQKNRLEALAGGGPKERNVRRVPEILKRRRGCSGARNSANLVEWR
jgi:hypothetical protein